MGTWGQNALTAQTQATAISQNAFWSFSITPSVSGVSLSDIAAFYVWLYDQNASTAPPNDFFGIWQYRVNSNPFTDIGSSAQLGSVSQGAGNMQAAVSLSGIASLQSMAAGTQADFRFVVWGAGYGANYAGFNSFQAGNDLIVNGVLPVPEPTACGLAAVGLIMCGAWARHCRRQGGRRRGCRR